MSLYCIIPHLTIVFVVELTTDSLITERRLYRRKIPGESTEKLAENKDSREIALF